MAVAIAEGYLMVIEALKENEVVVAAEGNLEAVAIVEGNFIALEENRVVAVAEGNLVELEALEENAIFLKNKLIKKFAKLDSIFRYTMPSLSTRVSEY